MYTMRPLRSTIQALRTHGKSLAEPFCDCFSAEPPSGGRWPKGLPSSPLFDEFYAACDGGDLGPFSFLPMAEIAADTESAADWMEDVAPEGLPPRGRWLVFGRNDYGHELIWDADRDAVLLYDSDGGDLWDADDAMLAYDGSGPGSTGHLTLARFFERLVNPAASSDDEATELWTEALESLDRLIVPF
jgi:hypothetical protein